MLNIVLELNTKRGRLGSVKRCIDIKSGMNYFNIPKEEQDGEVKYQR